MIPLAETPQYIHYAAIVGILILLEGLLSADNALVIAIIVKGLPRNERRKALFVGLIGSFVLRFLALFTASTLQKFWFLQAGGALYLIYLAITHLFRHQAHRKQEIKVKRKGFWQTVVLIELTDIAFAIDSVLVAVAVSNELWVIYTGVILGVILLRFAAFVLTRVIEKYPGLEHMAYALVFWVGIKLGVQSVVSLNEYHKLGWRVVHMSPVLFWTVTAAIIVIGIALSLQVKRKPVKERKEVLEIEKLLEGNPDSDTNHADSSKRSDGGM
ncbi:MAG TPA: hypothetical protein VNK96_10020 [Fimbriimonadales bacterium]|nr:hypothetical protein [Fimbriimonadales bacterium]